MKWNNILFQCKHVIKYNKAKDDKFKIQDVITSFLRRDHSVQFSSVQSLSRVRLFATPWTVAYQAPPPMAFSRQEWVAISFSRGSSWPRDWTHISCLGGISCLAGSFFTTEPPGKTPLCGVERLIRFPYQQEIRPLLWDGSHVSSTPLFPPEGNESSFWGKAWLI